MDTLFLAFLTQHDDGAWLRTVDRLEQACHPVERPALRIWFRLYPLSLQRAMEAAETLDRARNRASVDKAAPRHGAEPAGPVPLVADGERPVLSEAGKLAARLRLDGRWRLADQIDTSHRFFYGHRYWPEVKAAVIAFATRGTAPGSLDLAAQVQEIARELAAGLGRPVDELVAIVAVGVRTLQQVGLEALASAPGTVAVAGTRSADAELAARLRDDSQGLLGRFRGDRRKWTVRFGAGEADTFPLVHSQHITTAAAADTRDHRGTDARCTEGPIPVQCRSCSCGTCWVGVLGGADKLSPIEERERRKLAACGYSDSTDSHPVIRLACMAQAFGAITIVIPPWNGQIGRS